MGAVMGGLGGVMGGLGGLGGDMVIKRTGIQEMREALQEKVGGFGGG